MRGSSTAVTFLLVAQSSSPGHSFLNPTTIRCLSCHKSWSVSQSSVSKSVLSMTSSKADKINKTNTLKGGVVDLSPVTKPIKSVSSGASKLVKGAEAAKNVMLESTEPEDERKTARWGASPPSKNPVQVVKAGLDKVGQGVTAAKDVLYNTAETVEDLAGAVAASRSSVEQAPTSVPVKASPLEVAGAGLRLFGVVATTFKDAFWSSLDVLDGVVETAQAAPDTARTVVEGGKSAIEGTKESVAAISRAPAAAASAVSGAVESVAGAAAGVGKAATAVKDGVYGAADTVVSIPSKFSDAMEKMRLQKVEMERRQAEREADRRAALRRLQGAVGRIKDALWGTVGTVEGVVDAVASAPEAGRRGVEKAREAQEAVKEFAAKAQEIPTSLKEVPVKAMKRVEEVKASIAESQARATALAQGVQGAATSVVDLVTGEGERKRVERRKEEEVRKKKEKMKEALVVVGGEPFTGEDIALGSVKVLGIAIKGLAKLAFETPGAVKKAIQVPDEVARKTLGPFYEYQQSQKRLQEAIIAESVAAATAASTAASAGPPSTGGLSSDRVEIQPKEGSGTEPGAVESGTTVQEAVESKGMKADEVAGPGVSSGSGVTGDVGDRGGKRRSFGIGGDRRGARGTSRGKEDGPLTSGKG